MKTLTVFHANLNQHSGDFACTAVNELGASEKQFFVKILGKIDFLKSLNFRNFQI